MRIGELAHTAGVSTKAIRFYESIGVLPDPARTASGYRQYAVADAERLAFVKTAQRFGLRLDEIREIVALRDRGLRPCDYVAGVVDRRVREIDQRVAEMVSLRDELVRLQDAACSRAGATCEVVEHLYTGTSGAAPDVPGLVEHVELPRHR